MVERLLGKCTTEEDYKELEDMIRVCSDVFVAEDNPESLDKYIKYFSLDLGQLEVADEIVTEMFLERR